MTTIPGYFYPHWLDTDPDAYKAMMAMWMRVVAIRAGRMDLRQDDRVELGERTILSGRRGGCVIHSPLALADGIIPSERLAVASRSTPKLDTGIMGQGL